MLSFPIRAIQVVLLIQQEDNSSIKYQLLEGLGMRTADSLVPRAVGEGCSRAAFKKVAHDL